MDTGAAFAADAAKGAGEATASGAAGAAAAGAADAAATGRAEASGSIAAADDATSGLAGDSEVTSTSDEAAEARESAALGCSVAGIRVAGMLSGADCAIRLAAVRLSSRLTGLPKASGLLLAGGAAGRLGGVSVPAGGALTRPEATGACEENAARLVAAELAPAGGCVSGACTGVDVAMLHRNASTSCDTLRCAVFSGVPRVRLLLCSGHGNRLRCFHAQQWGCGGLAG